MAASDKWHVTSDEHIQPLLRPCLASFMHRASASLRESSPFRCLPADKAPTLIERRYTSAKVADLA